jgi:hypothetical protein
MKKEQLIMLAVTVVAVLIANFVQDKIDERKNSYEAPNVGDDELM